jgi:hypothetical protein
VGFASGALAFVALCALGMQDLAANASVAGVAWFFFAVSATCIIGSVALATAKALRATQGNGQLGAITTLGVSLSLLALVVVNDAVLGFFGALLGSFGF